MDISLKVNKIARLEFKLAYLEAAVSHFSHYAMRTPPYHQMPRTLVVGCSYPPAGMQLVYSTASADRMGHVSHLIPPAMD